MFRVLLDDCTPKSSKTLSVHLLYTLGVHSIFFPSIRIYSRYPSLSLYVHECTGVHVVNMTLGPLKKITFSLRTSFFDFLIFFIHPFRSRLYTVYMCTLLIISISYMQF